MTECKASFLHSAKKFYPLHWFTLLLVIYFSRESFIQTPVETVITLFLNACLLQTWAPPEEICNSFNGVSWYISILMFIACVSPLIVRLISKVKIKACILSMIAIIAAVFTVPFLVGNWKYGSWFVYRFPIMRLMDYIWGCFVFMLYHWYGDRIKTWASTSLFFGFMALDFGLILLNVLYGHLVFSVACWLIPSAGMIFTLACGDDKATVLSKIFGNRVMLFFGGITFEFYLLHWPSRLYAVAISQRLKLEGGIYSLMITLIELIFALVGSISIHYGWKKFLAFRQEKKQKKET